MPTNIQQYEAVQLKNYLKFDFSFPVTPQHTQVSICWFSIAWKTNTNPIYKNTFIYKKAFQTIAFTL